MHPTSRSTTARVDLASGDTVNIGRRLVQRWTTAFGPRVTGFPTSSNRASSFHLRWLGLPPDDRVVEASATLEIVEPPAVPQLYFWALQASFVDGTPIVRCRPSRPAMALSSPRWHCGQLGRVRRRPAASSTGRCRSCRAPPATRTPGTSAGSRAARTACRSVPARGTGDWRGSVDGHVVRELHGGGTGLADMMVWSEVFARCDDRSGRGAMERLHGQDAQPARSRPDRLAVSYQSKLDGGCDNTTVVVDGDGGADHERGRVRFRPAPCCRL